MDTLNVLLVGFDKNLNINFLNKEAERLQSLIGFNLLYTMLIRILQEENSDIKAIAAGEYQVEINRQQNIIAFNMEQKTTIFSYSFDLVEHHKDKDISNALFLTRISNRHTQQELIMLEEKFKTLNMSSESDKLKSEFFSNISHELRTPINVIMGTHQLINEHISNGNIDEIINSNEKYKSIIKKNCYRLLRLVNNLIDISKIYSGHYEMELCNCNIVSFVEDIVDSVASYAESKGLTLVFDTDVEEKNMAVDCEKLERAILNLLSNAVKFTLPGGNIIVNLYDKGDKVIISVKDTGIGIPKDKQQVIFERYKRLSSNHNKSMIGSGIGLSLVKSLIEMHMGTIKVISENNEGSEFIIELPVMLVDNGTWKLQSQSSRDMNAYLNIELSDISGETFDLN